MSRISLFLLPVIGAVLLICGFGCAGTDTGDKPENAEKPLTEKETQGYTGALRWAVSKGNLKVVKSLVAKGADVNSRDKDGWNALIWAVHCGHKDISMFLIEKGSDLNLQDNDGETALMRAIRDGETDVALELIKRGADLNLKSNVYDRTALSLAIQERNKTLIDELLKNGAH